MQAFGFFNTLPLSIQQNITSHMIIKKLAKGERLYYEGESVSSIFLISQGSLRIHRCHDNGYSVTLYRVDDEVHNIDIVSASQMIPALGTAEAEVDSEVFVIDLELLESVLADHMGYKAFLLQQAMARSEYLADMIHTVRFSSLDDRIFSWLKQKSQKVLRVTHEEIAYYHGTSREVVSRVLKKFEKRGLLRLSRKEIALLDTPTELFA